MITTGILNIIYWGIVLIISPITLLNDVTLPTNIVSAISNLQIYFHSFNQYVPIDTLLIIFSTVITIEGFILLYKITMWVIRRIPGQG